MRIGEECGTGTQRHQMMVDTERVHPGPYGPGSPGPGGPRDSRRDFLKTAGASALAAAAPWVIPSSALGRTAPSNRINVGVIGLGTRGIPDMQTFMQNDDVQVGAVSPRVRQVPVERYAELADSIGSTSTGRVVGLFYLSFLSFLLIFCGRIE